MACVWRDQNGRSIETVLRHLVLGAAWHAFRTVGTRAFRMMTALSRSYDDMNTAMCRMMTELNPNTTEQMIGEWERAVALPDACLPSTRTLDERRFWVLWRLKKKRWNTRQDWIDIAALFGLQIRITPGWLVQEPALYDAKYPKRYDQFGKLGRFRVYIDILGQRFPGYPYDGTKNGSDKYPIPYGTGFDHAGFRCLIERVAPANVLIIWNEFPPVTPRGNGITFSPDFDTEFS